MAKKHRNYIPQKRRSSEQRPTQNIENEPASERDSSVEFEDTLRKLADLFEIDSVAESGEFSTLCGSLSASIVGSGNLLTNIGLLEPDEADITKESLMALLPELVISTRNAALKLADKGFDRISSHEIIPRKDFAVLFKEMLGQYMDMFGVKSGNPDDIDFSNFNLNSVDIDALQDAEGLEMTAYNRLIRVYGLSKRMAHMVKESGGIGSDLYDDFRNDAIKGLEREMELNPNTVRRNTTKSLQYLFSNEVTSVLRHFGYIDDEEQDAIDHENDTYPAQELDFKILPAGTDLREFAETIVERLNDRDKAHVDLDRLNVLNATREYAGKDRCYFAHGKKTGSQMLDYETDTLIDEDYIVLVIQDLNETGETLCEHALAISPIAQKHAAYLTRNDVSAGSWREILSLPKQDARYFGARDLRFTGSSGRTPYAMMEEKIKALLECHSDDFQKKLRMRADGTYRLENNAREVGRSASKHIISIA